MKKVLIPFVGTFGATVIVISGISNFQGSQQVASPAEHSLPASGQTQGTNQVTTSPNSAQQVKTLGLVKINYRLHHLPRLASNQLAVWIEDEQGNYVKSLFATSFTANGGYHSRPESLPEWRKAANWENASPDKIKSVSRPEQGEGNQSLYWDCTDESGKPVKPGTYTYKIEGNIQWENRVVYTGKIVIGDQKSTTSATARFTPNGAETKGTLVEQVSADFLPGEVMDASKGQAMTQTRGS